MCLVEQITYVYPDGRRLLQPYHNLCDDSRGGNPCKGARYHDLGERRMTTSAPGHDTSSPFGYPTTQYRPSPPSSDTMSQSKHSRKGSSQDSTNWKGAFTRPARRLSIFGNKDKKKTHNKDEVVVDQMSSPSSPLPHSTLEAPPVIRNAWSDPLMTRDRRSSTAAYGGHRPSIRPVSYAGAEPKYEIRTPTGTTPTEGRGSKRTSRNYASTQVIQDPPVRPPEMVHGMYTPRSSWNRPPPPPPPEPSTHQPKSTCTPQATNVPPPPPSPPTPPSAEATAPSPPPYPLDEPVTPTAYSTDPEISRFQHRETQRRLTAQLARQAYLEDELAILRARLAEQEAAERSAADARRRTEQQQAAHRQRTRTFRERQEAASAEQQEAERQRERKLRERQDAATKAAAAAREADRQYKDTAQRVARLQAEVEELRLRRQVVQERFVDRIDADAEAAARRTRAHVTSSSHTHRDGLRGESSHRERRRREPRTEGHRTPGGGVYWTETERGGERQREGRRSDGRAAARNRDVREMMEGISIGDEEAVELEESDAQEGTGHSRRRRRRRRRHSHDEGGR